ncbi:delta-sarcoglycan isoform X2 [Aphelocoma coerulescens]|uniref:delta-sarcoglycan isoform X2 n=1 Tax=Aphelocoma coerulescens TaxID=39617 RepID=UPI003604FC59
MPQEQYAHRSTMQTSEGPQVYKVGIYGWRKRCLYFFVLLLMILILVNLAMTIWILKVMNFTIDGMGNLRITEKGLKLEGDSEFLKPLYAKEIRSRPGNPLYFQSARNVTVNILNENTKVLTRLVTGPQAVEAHSQKFEVKTLSGKLLFSADDNEVVVGAERLRVLALLPQSNFISKSVCRGCLPCWEVLHHMFVFLGVFLSALKASPSRSTQTNSFDHFSGVWALRCCWNVSAGTHLCHVNNSNLFLLLLNTYLL